MASGISVSEINRTLRNKILFGCVAFFWLVWIAILEQAGWMFFVFDAIPGKLFLFFVFTLAVAVLGVVVYAYFYIPPLKGFLVRLAGSCFTLAFISVSCAIWGIPNVQKIEFTSSRVLIGFYAPPEPGPFLSLTSVCVIGLLVTGFFYIVADLIDGLRRQD